MQPKEISSKDIHIYCLRYVICIVASDNFIGFDEDSAPIKCLPSEHPTESAIIREAYDLNDLIHGPTVELFVTHYGQGDCIGLLVFLDCFEGIISITNDTFIDRK